MPRQHFRPGDLAERRAMPRHEVLLELLPIVVDRAAAAVLPFQIHLVTCPCLRQCDVRAGPRQGLSTSATPYDGERGSAGVASLCVWVFAEFAADNLAPPGIPLLALVPVGLAALSNLDDESAHVAVPDDVPGLCLSGREPRDPGVGNQDPRGSLAPGTWRLFLHGICMVRYPA